jgi:hypothetical protein
VHGRSSAPVYVVFMYLFMVYRRCCGIQYRMVGLMNFRDPREKRAWPNLDNRNLTQGSAENRKKTSGRPVFRSRLMLKEAAMALSETRSQQSTRRTEGKPQKRQSRSLVSRPRVETGHPEYRIGVLRARSRRSEYMVCRQVSRMCLSAYSCQPELPSLMAQVSF